MEVYGFSNIIEIDKDKLKYTDKSGVAKYVYFDECRSNWVKHVNQSGDFVTWDGQPYKNINEEDTNCVGQRDWFADKPYFEFFTTPVIRFEIIPKRRVWEIFMKHWKQRYYQEFHKISSKLSDCGWSTLDLG
ncbi:MAG: hypothetical protein Q8936_13390 [Bacillota bacterium]|nr:hypothetical protein [Bacillota bacterium]